MKKQQKKAFTLVELLVVIAILAILASVAVVGYTAFIKNAAVSNDENVVAQMNRYLEALQADSSSDYYNVEIDAGNVKQLTAHILQESGMNQLKPEAEKYGYDFYFNFAEGKYEHKHIDEAGASNISRNFFRGTYVFATDGESTETAKETYLENSFTQGNNLFLVSTAGALFDLINSVYALGGTNGECDIETINNFIENDLNGTIIYEVVKTKSTIVRNGSQYRPNGDKSDDASNTVVVIYLNNVTSISATTYVPNETEPFVASVIANVDKITVPETVSSVDKGALNMNSEEYKVEFSGRTSEEVAAMGVDAMTNAQLELKDGTHKSTENGIVNVETNEEKSYTYENKLVGFAIYDNEETDSLDGIVTSPYATMRVDGNIISVPAEISTLTLVFDYINGSEGSDKPLMGASNITCTTEGVESTYSVLGKSLTVDFTNQTIPDSFAVTITNNAGVTQEFTVNVEDITAGTVTFNGTALVEDETPNMTVITSSSGNITYAIAKGDYTYTHNNLGVCDETITATFSSDCAEVVYDEDGSCSLLAKTNGSGILTITVGSEAYTYLTYTVNLTIADTSNFAVQPANKNITVVGNGNAVNVSELFMLKDGVEIPEGAELVVFAGGSYNGDTYMTPNRNELQATEGAELGLSVDSPRQVITRDNFNGLTLDFDGADANNAIRIAVMHNGVRISEDVIVTVVDGYNVRSYADLTSNVNTTADKNGNYSYPLTNNVVFLADITMSGDVNFLQIPADKTLYGNGFKFDITKGRLKEEGIINLKGTLRDVMVVGAVYSTFAFSAGDDYGSSAVNANQSAEGKYARIINCYIANTRSPLRTSGNTIVEDTVLFGGRYSNINMTGGTVTIRGTVTTVQQLYNNVIGMGVSAWFNDGKKNVVIEEDANLVQYNFIANSNDIKNSLPVLKLKGIYTVMDLKEPFNAMFGDTTTYGAYMYTGSNGNKYVNSGIISTDKYMLDYDVTGDAAEIRYKLYVIPSEYYLAVGKTKTLKLNTAVGDDELFTITCPSGFTCGLSDADTTTAGLQLTGKDLKAGVTFTVTTEVKYAISSIDEIGDGTNYMFLISNENYLTVEVNDDASQQKYSNITYNFSKDMSPILGLGEKLSISMADRGIHYGTMCVGVNTPTVSNYYKTLLEQYIEMTDGDGEGDNFYTPENFQFVNGSVTNYWD